MKPVELPRSVLDRHAVVYVRQSSMTQVEQNLESQRRQYELADVARSYGFVDVTVIDEDLRRSASGATHPAPPDVTTPNASGMLTATVVGPTPGPVALKIDWSHQGANRQSSRRSKTN